MPHTTIVIPQPAGKAALSCLSAWLQRACDELVLDADERFLRAARDLADLEWRLRCLERGRADRFAPLDPDA